jgi:hypothetical protein
MARPHAVLVAVLAGFAGAASCYSDRLPPPTFRHVCNGDNDCIEGEQCIDGLCQVPCTQATFSDDCPEGGGYAMCFNGVCSHVCQLPGGPCAAGQECLDLGFDLAALGGGGGGLFGGSDSDTPLGVCGRPCEDGCPTGEVCLQGFCVLTCDPAAEQSMCPFDFPCQGGLCLPDFGEGTGGEGGTLLATESITDTGDTGDATTTADTDGGTGGGTLVGTETGDTITATGGT